MEKKYFALLICLISPILLFSQPKEQQEKYDLSKDRVLYTIGYAHLDTEWLWDYPATIDICLRNTMEENFYLLEKYPDYVFNFTGSRRYKMMKEYYPEMYKKVVQYVKQGRWHVSGSSVDEGEVNISSSESLVRQVLYGNNYFRNEFGKESVDYMLPDCFGFLANVPSIWNHCGLLGFSTQKLSWGSAVGLPFNVGVWNGPDGKGIIAALNATSYVGKVVPRLDQDKEWDARLSADNAKYGFSFDYRYYGVGDQGGAPRENDVVNAVGSLKKSDSKFKVILTASDQMYKEFKGSKLDFDLSHYTIRSFAVKLEAPAKPVNKPEQQVVELPFNADVFSFDHNRSDGNFNRFSFPAELIPAEVVSEDIHFKMGSTIDTQNNAVNCRSQVINLPQGNYTKLCILASATADVKDNLKVDGTTYPLNVQCGTGFIGQSYNRNLTPDKYGVTSIDNAFVKQDNIAWFASHRHVGYPTKNDSYQYSYIYKYEINIPQGAKIVTLPNNQKIKIFAITAVQGNARDLKALQPLYDDFQTNTPIQLRGTAQVALGK